MTKVLQLLQKKVKITAAHSTFSDGSIKNKCDDTEDVHVLIDESSHSSWAELSGKLGGLQEHKLRGDWKFIQHHTEVDIGKFWRSFWMWNRLQVHLLHGTRSVLSHNPVGKSKSACLLRFRSMPGTERKRGCNWKMERSSGRIQNCPLLTKNHLESTEKQLNSSGRFSLDFRIDDSPRDPTWLRKKEHQIWRVHGPNHLQVNVQRHRLDKRGNGENCLSNAENVWNYAKRFLQGHWTFPGPRSEEKWYGRSSHLPNGEWDSTANEMVQRFKETGRLVL